MTLGVIVITCNESAHITACLRSVDFADKRLVFDSFSSDDTVALALAEGAQVIQRPFDNFAAQRNAALAAMTDVDWVLFVDADERVPQALAHEITTAMQHPTYAAWRVPRDNYLFGKLTRGAGWYPDYQTRLLRVGKAQYDPQRKVHELIVVDGKEGTFQAALIHYNYRDVAQFIAKQRQYTALEAQILFEQGVRAKPQNDVLQPLRQFWWRFVTLKGFRDGWHGLRLSVLMAWYELRKYQMLRKLWGKPPEMPAV